MNNRDEIWKTQIKWWTFATSLTSTLSEAESVEELDIDESTQRRQPALKPNTSAGLLPVPTSASGSSSSESTDSAPSFLSRLRSPHTTQG